jgi:hypothetical protein
MNKNVKIAKELVKLAKSLVADDVRVADKIGEEYKDFTGWIKYNGEKVYVCRATFKLEWYKEWTRIIWEDGEWCDGVWCDGIWKNGTWDDGRWIDGIWKNGTWRNGTWEDGTWEDGIWHSGTWIGGTWKHGKNQYGEEYSNSPKNW